jgi:hypothetical protein
LYPCLSRCSAYRPGAVEVRLGTILWSLASI